jgi:choline dehydrogenase-like flavoprotein
MPDLLSNAQHRTLAALAESIAPPGSPLPVDANQMGVADQLDALVRDFDPASALPPLRSLSDVSALERRRFHAMDVKVSAYHPMGTARMGPDARSSVCDAEGRVHGTENVYVADTSVFPASTYVNPQLTLMALCLNVAERFLDRWPGRH